MPSTGRYPRAYRAACATILLLVTSAPAVSDPGTDDGAADEHGLAWIVLESDGHVVGSSRADRPINPASLVKVLTSWWALERLGAEHRFVTEFRLAEPAPGADGSSRRELRVRGGGDPDFHVENAWLVARRIGELGVLEVGSLAVDRSFWIGWEGGSARREPHPRRRGRQMAHRLRAALDPSRWDRATAAAWDDFRTRRGSDSGPPEVVVRGPARPASRPGVPEPGPAVVHHSNPLQRILKRFNAYSNNDIERLGSHLGGPAALTDWIGARWGARAEGLRLRTLSGLGSNRMTPRQVVRALEGLATEAARQGLSLADLLPVAGCDAGTLESFPRLAERARGAVVAKTGTLTETDGGVAVLAGRVATEAGERLFCVAVPRAGSDVARARRLEEAWLLGWIERSGGAKPRACPRPAGHSDDEVRVLVRE